MELTRSVFEDFLKWKNSADRKPLIVEGARQIGKTWAMKRFGELHYKHTAYFNFESSEDLGREFEKTKDPRRILDVLQLYANQEIVPGDTLVIFDEIQSFEGLKLSLILLILQRDYRIVLGLMGVFS